jgi:hypothetical protein
MNNIEPKYVTFEQAKWLEKIGFNIKEYLRIDNENPLNLNSNFNPREYQPWYLDLNQWQVVEWLRINHDIEICHVTYKNTKGKYDCIIIADCFDTEMSTMHLTRNKWFNSPQEAYSAAFDYIKENNLI